VKRVVILGSTGSIGRQAVEIAASRDDLEVAGLAVATSWEECLVQAGALGSGIVAIADPVAAELADGRFDGTVLAGPEAAVELIGSTTPDVVLNAIVGARGLGPSIHALALGIDLALANKESLVIAGELLTDLAAGTGARILPVDSEHSALEQLLRGETADRVRRLTLTASGGPFRGRTSLESVTVEEALDHPTWKMGGRITVDSATLMNKGLEMIEAHHLFGLPYDRIAVVIHPQSIVHSLVDLSDGASLAHLGLPDMRVPIAYALGYPERFELPIETLDLAEVGSLEFEAPDTETFPCLELAREAGQAGGISPCVLNASDEEAVQAFLDGEITFDRIPEVVQKALDDVGSGPVRDFDELIAVDEASREISRELIGAIAGK
jgi:1-deoxy-D-xylulose-5-phosphate reductoisomerase